MTEYILPFAKVILTSFVSVFIIFNFMERIFKRKYFVRRIYVIAFILGCLLFIASAFFANGLISISISVSLTFIIAICLYNARKSSDILIVCLFLVFIMLTEIVGQIIISLISIEPVSISHGDILQSMTTFTCYQLVMYFLMKQKKEFNNAGNWITLVVIPAISLFQIIVLFYLLKDQTDSNSKILVLSACLLMFVINIVIYFLFNRIANLNYDKSQYQLLEQQRQLQYKYFNELEQNYEESKKFFHDIKNHLNIIEELYKSTDSSTKGYTKTIKSEIKNLELHKPSNNRIINILIHKWLPKAQKYGIDFSYQCEDVDLSFMTDMDLATILSNLLDNAFEECLENNLEANFVDFNLCKINDFIVISLSNSSESVPTYSGEQLLSGKENHFGLGLKNVQTTVEKYQGLMNIKYPNQVFTIQITFFGQG